MNVYFSNGRCTSLGPELKHGGEGYIHEFAENRGKFAKIYISDAKSKKSKILTMLRIGSSAKFEATHLHNSLAWPRADLYDKRGNFAGFGMDKIESIMDINDVYVSPPTPQNANITFSQKIICLVSLCSVVSRLHKIGVVVGDFNPDNIKVMPDYSIKLVDTDNFHLGNSADMRCVACFPGYVAPEILRVMHGHTYADCPSPTFTVDSDNFALAIHIFEMLFNGCHPYKQKRVTHYAKGSPPAAKKEDSCVEDGECLFFKPQKNLRTPVWAPETNHFPSYLTDMFKRAFVDGHTNPKARPHPDEWITVLNRYKNDLVTCKSNRMHSYWREAKTCPYCDAEDRRSKKAATVALNQTTTNNTVVAKYNTTTQSHQIAPPISKTLASNHRQAGISPGLYWFLSIVLSLGIIFLFTTTFLKPINYSVVEDSDILSRRSVLPLIVSGIIGFIGLFVYSTKWSPRKNTDFYTAPDIFLAVLSVAGFTLLGFFAAALIVKIVDAIVKAIVWIIIIIIGIAALGGG